MMLIEGHWETVDTLQDVAKIIREYYNEELSDKMDELIEETKDDERLEELENIIEEIRELVL